MPFASYGEIRLVVTMAPVFTNGFAVCVGISTTAFTELKARPVGSLPIRSNTRSARTLFHGEGQRVDFGNCRKLGLSASYFSANRKKLAKVLGKSQK